jgi:hypothetical protein
MTKSILQTEKECYICHTTQNLQRHHVYYGTANRKLSEEDGCVVYLCMEHHTGRLGIHFNKKENLKLKQECEKAWLDHYGKTKEDFIRRYGRNYL